MTPDRRVLYADGFDNIGAATVQPPEMSAAYSARGGHLADLDSEFWTLPQRAKRHHLGEDACGERTSWTPGVYVKYESPVLIAV